MKTNPIRQLCFYLYITLTVLAGCSKSGLTALAPEKIPTALNEAFKQSSSNEKMEASECAMACQNQNVTTAFMDLQKLSQSKDLTPEQRKVTTLAMAATFQKLRAASENGDASAQALLHQYISTR